MVRGARRPQSLIKQISQILLTPRLDDIRRPVESRNDPSDRGPEVPGPQPSPEHKTSTQC